MKIGKKKIINAQTYLSSPTLRPDFMETCVVKTAPPGHSKNLTHQPHTILGTCIHPNLLPEWKGSTTAWWWRPLHRLCWSETKAHQRAPLVNVRRAGRRLHWHTHVHALTWAPEEEVGTEKVWLHCRLITRKLTENQMLATTGTFSTMVKQWWTATTSVECVASQSTLDNYQMINTW